MTGDHATTGLTLFVRFVQLNPWINANEPWLADVLDVYETLEVERDEDEEVVWL